MVSRFGERQMLEATAHADDEATEIVEAVMADALADADGEINSYISGRYALPLAEVPRMLVTVACDIARYRLYKDDADEVVTDRYKAAVAFLKDVSAGRAALGIAAPQTEEVAASGGILMDIPDRIFTRTSLSDF